MKKNKLKKILSTFAVSMMIISTITGCSNSGSNVTDNNQNLNNALIIEKAAMIPVIDGRASSAGVYIHNTSNQTIRGISYGLVNNNSKTSLTLNQASCNSIAANSSCLLPLTTPALTAGNRGSNILVASYNNQQSKQLLNYRYIKSSDYSGVNFSDNSQSLFGTNDYATVYVFVGNSQAQNNVGFANSSDSLAISNGLTNGKVNIPANTVIPLEIHSNQNVTASIVTVTPYTVTSTRNLSKALTAALQNNSQLQVTITPTMQANLLMSNLPILSQNESTATLAIVNNGNQSASNINLTAVDNSITVGSATTNPCTGTLAVGASCNYQINLNNHDNNGTTLITLDYNNSLIDTSTTQNVYYLNNNAEPMVAVVPTQSSFTEQVSTNQNITFNLNNLGNVPLNNLIPKINTTLGHTTVTIQNNNCGNTLAANGNCQIQLNVAASGLIDSGIIYLNISGTYTGSSAKSYSFMSKPVYITITDPSNPTVTSTTPQDTTTGVSKATGIVINFSEPMTPTTLTNSNIKLQKVSDDSDVPLTAQGVTGNNQTVTFTHADLVDTTQYKIIINPSQIKDINGNAISDSTSQIISTFSTADSTPPTVSNVIPTNGATNQSKTPAITLTFSKAMDQSTLTSANIMLATSGGGAVSGYTVNYDTSNHVATLNLTGALAEQTSYKLSINQQNVKDTSGNAMGSNSSYLVSQFTTGDFTAPTLSSTIPVNGATSVATESPISLTFSESMDTTTLSTTTIKLQKVSDSSYVNLNSPSYSNGNKMVTFQPSANLLGGESYNIIINPSQIKDLAGNPMSAGSSQTVSNYYVINVISGWTKQVGAAGGTTNGMGVSVDNSGNSYVIGYTTVGISDQTQTGTNDYFIAKYDSSGVLQWTKQVGVTGKVTYGYGISVDSSGNSYVIGVFRDSLIDYYFIAKYDTIGALQWTKQVGGATNGGTYGQGISVDSIGNSYVTGYTTVGISGQTQTGVRDYFIAKYDSNGTLKWTKQVGVSGNDATGYGISVDKNGNGYVTGYTYGGISGQTQTGFRDYFIAKYDSNGILKWTKQVGASGGLTTGYGISVDSSGNSYVTGVTNRGISGQTQTGNNDYFIAKYDTSGALEWTKQVGAESGSTNGRGISVDSSGNSYVTGVTNRGISGQTQTGNNDYFIAKYDSNGILKWTKQVGASGGLTTGYGISVDGSGNGYVTGVTNRGISGQTQIGLKDYFIAKTSSTGQ